jgi:hypothetical protein
VKLYAAKSWCRRACANAAKNGRWRRPHKVFRHYGGQPRLCADEMLRFDMPHHPNLLRVFTRGSKLARAIRRYWRVSAALLALINPRTTEDPP